MEILPHPWERLRQERERLGFNQTDFAAFGGVSKMAQTRYEKGTRKPDGAYFEGIARAGADITYILTGEPRALRESLRNIKEATSTAAAISADPKAVSALQTVIFQGLQTARGDEVKLLFDYRRCSPPDQKTIKQMAARLAGDAPAAKDKKRD